MPIRAYALGDSIHRIIRYGDLVNFFMLDERTNKPLPDFASTNLPGRSILGSAQFDWLNSELNNSTTQWNILGQSAIMAPLDNNPLPFGQQYADAAQWDGYATERTSFYDSILSNNIQNIVVLSSNIGGSFANDLPTSTYNGSTGAGSAGVEFVTPSITEPVSPILSSVGASTLQSFNEHMKYAELTHHGYLILDVNQIRTQSDWYFVDNITTNSSIETFDRAWYTNNNSRHLLQEFNFSTASNQYGKTFAPEMPIVIDLDSYATINATGCFSYTSPSESYIWTTSNTYFDTIPNSIGGDSIITINLTINTIDLSIAQTSNMLSANEVGATYQWLNCPELTAISGATNQSYTATSNGDYAVVISKNGCSDTSTCYSVANIGIIENSFGSELLVYPNPTNGNFSIDLGKTYSSVSLTIKNLNGQKIQSEKFEESQLLKLNLDQPTGIYLVTIESDDYKAVIKLVKE